MENDNSNEIAKYEEQETALVSTVTYPIEPFFHPEPRREPSSEYMEFYCEEFIRVRQMLLDAIRNKVHENKGILDDFIDSLLMGDPDIPTDILSTIQIFFKVGGKARRKTKKRELYRKVVVSLLEKIFDPELEFKMTSKRIHDTFQANGLDRHKVTGSQIDTVYSRIVEKLETGLLRDITHKNREYLLRYVRVKLNEIEICWSAWRCNR